MEKLVYVLWRRDDRSARAFKDQLLGETAEALIERAAQGLSVNLVDEYVAHTGEVRITRLDPPPAGLLSLWLNDAEDREPLEEAIHRASSRLAGYLVVESVPRVNTTHTAPLGERTPGINVVSLIE